MPARFSLRDQNLCYVRQSSQEILPYHSQKQILVKFESNKEPLLHKNIYKIEVCNLLAILSAPM